MGIIGVIRMSLRCRETIYAESLLSEHVHRTNPRRPHDVTLLLCQSDRAVRRVEDCRQLQPP
jgi:hypothetical protein